MACYIFYHGPINPQGVRNLESLISEATKKTDREIILCICSGGGDVAAGIGAYNFLKMQQMPITTYAFGICGSIAATMFLAGEKRLCSTVCSFTLHAATFTDGPRKGEISDNTPLIARPFQVVAKWENARIVDYFGTATERFIFPEQAKEFGIITEIADIKMTAVDESIHVNIPL